MNQELLNQIEQLKNQVAQLESDVKNGYSNEATDTLKDIERTIYEINMELN